MESIQIQYSDVQVSMIGHKTREEENPDYNDDFDNEDDETNIKLLNERESKLSKFIEPLTQLLKLKLSNDLSVSDFTYDSDEGILGVGIQNSTVLSKLGRVWSIIEPDILGVFFIFLKQQLQGKSIPGFQLVYQKEFEEKVMSVAYQADLQKFFIGFHSGKLGFLSLNKEEPDKMNFQSVVISNECILFLTFINIKKLLFITPTSLKIISTDKHELIGGGSLKQRLKDSYINCYQYDTKNSHLYLTSSGGSLFVYQVGEKLEFVYSMNPSSTIETIILKNGNVFCATGQDTATFQFKADVKKKVESEKVTAIAYIASKKIFCCGLSNGLIVFWNALTGDIIGAQRDNVTQISKIYLNEEKEIIIIGYNSGDLKIYKYGIIPLEVYQELQIQQQQQQQQ